LRETAPEWQRFGPATRDTLSPIPLSGGFLPSMGADQVMKAAALRLAIIGLALLGGCSRTPEASTNNVAAANNSTAPAATPSPTASATPTIAGFDPANAPVANPTLGAWPYFGLMEGYAKGSLDNAASYESKKYWADVAYDRYEFFDGFKLIPVEGRLYTTMAIGKGASIFQVQKTYEKLVHDLGGVTVYEGSGQPMLDKKIKFADPRFRANYRVQDDNMGVYMVRTPTSEIWVEVYHPWEDNSQNYWVTIVEKKALEVKVKMLPAAEMLKALDSAGHVTLYINFDTDKTTIKPDSQPIVAEIVKLLQANPTLKLTVEGHTDNAGTPAHNQTLSEGRANVVVGTLMAQGIAGDRLQAKGFGQTKPLADNGSEDGRSKNRRVELVKR
jgi:OmpA-OmpF porin, OOP family